MVKTFYNEVERCQIEKIHLSLYNFMDQNHAKKIININIKNLVTSTMSVISMLSMLCRFL